MSVAPEILAIFGWRDGRPNIADRSSATSVRIASTIFSELGISRVSTDAGQTLGRQLEAAVGEVLRQRLVQLDQARSWIIGSQPITEFAQYAHLGRVADMVDRSDPDGTLESVLGDYLIRPDITIGIGTSALPHLHAAVSCKWTIRSDRVQNIRHEGVVLTRHRRGRHPHFVAVTAEPLPSRLAAIAEGTGEVDCVYHPALAELFSACTDGRPAYTLQRLVAQDRLRTA